jgi:hypothetical protein
MVGLGFGSEVDRTFCASTVLADPECDALQGGS